MKHSRNKITCRYNNNFIEAEMDKHRSVSHNFVEILRISGIE